MEEEKPQELDNERIDLSQFDAITPGNWEVIDAPNGGIHIGVRLGENAHQHIITFTDSLGAQVKKVERDVADMNAIAAAPRLIAELKKCYEEIDSLNRELENWGLALCPRSNEWFEWDYGCQSEKCASFDDDCRELADDAE